MVLDPQKPLLARHEFVIGASRGRVWDLLATNVIQSMPIEQMDFLNDTTLMAILNVKLAFIAVPVPVKVDVADVSPMESFTTVVTASKAGLRSVLRVSFKLDAVEEERTLVTCSVVEEEGSPVMRLLRWQQRQFAGQIFSAVRDRLQHAA